MKSRIEQAKLMARARWPAMSDETYIGRLHREPGKPQQHNGTVVVQFSIDAEEFVLSDGTKFKMGYNAEHDELLIVMG